MRKTFLIILAVVLLGSVALAGVAQSAEPKGPQIFDTDIIINVKARTMEISFRYEDVAGSIDDAKMIVLITSTSANGKVKLNRIPLKVVDPNRKRNSKTTFYKITQGSAKYYASLPSWVDVKNAKDIVGAGLVVTDSLGRKARLVFIEKQVKKKNKPLVI